MNLLTQTTTQLSQATADFCGLILTYQNQSLPYPKPSSCSMEKLEVKPSLCICREGRVPQWHSPGHGGTDSTEPLRLRSLLGLGRGPAALLQVTGWCFMN